VVVPISTNSDFTGKIVRGKKVDSMFTINQWKHCRC
jgi:hypothetical protein